MRFFKRGGDESLDARLATFWAWWAGARDDIARDIPTRLVARHTGAISEAVAGIDKRLAWELGKGQSSQHMLVVTPEGNAEVRPIALAWLASAPPPDATWEYHPSRQPGEPKTLVVAGATIELSEVRVIGIWDDSREVVDVFLWHPAFEPLVESARQQISLLFLDNLLGEDDVERWVGAIEIDPSALEGGTPEELAAEVRRRAPTATGDAWAIAEGTDARGNPVLMRYNASVKRIDHPLANHHLAVSVDGGLEHADDEDRRRLVMTAEEQLDTDLSGTAFAIAFITEAEGRTMHFVCEDSVSASAIAHQWASLYPELSPKIVVESDPRWTFRSAYTA